MYNGLWKQRNAEIHQRREDHRSRQDHLRAETVLKAFYLYENEVGAHDKDIFHKPGKTDYNA